ncbi:hypothetical protein [Leeuwenhoekiella sp. W20_SRS_FM14]|uniref:hypothetical protein n=1 Tax=Leeuwenhoekiella sp. W20_SRS_FM14 TaxID=3240270 RepID=UPI003F9C8976
MRRILKSLMLLCFILCTGIVIAQEPETFNTENYILYKPSKTDAVLMLFGGFGEDGVGIENEFPITDLAISKNVAVVYLNYNRKIILQDEEKTQLAAMLQTLISSNNLPKNAIYIGGLSSGGAMALLISNYLTENVAYGIKPVGVFAVDSPIDLAAMYRIAKQNVERNFSPAAAGESAFMLQYFNTQLGDPDVEITPYEKYSSFVYETENFQNLKALKNTKIRLYTEPDKTWWKQNMGVEYEQMNAFHLERMSQFLMSQDYEQVELITTEDKGYRADGTRHPHSWSIVDQEDLLQWILD